MLSLGRKPDGSAKDTLVNIEARGDFVVHIPHGEMLAPLNESAATLAAGESEVERLGLELTRFPGSSLPRLADCRLALACERYEIRQIGHARQSLILGLVKRLFVDDSIGEQQHGGRIKIHADRLDPLGRLGASEYLEFGKVISLARPK
jgi:flavin reductase (DIM6/NTAB) family NADH-FMN oxidoreductase RutF